MILALGINDLLQYSLCPVTLPLTVYRLCRFRVVPDEEDKNIAENGEETYPPNLRALVLETEVDAWLASRKVTRDGLNTVGPDRKPAVGSASNAEYSTSTTKLYT